MPSSVKTVREKFSGGVADNIRILYGGSVNSKNATSIFSCADVDGGLIGGASLKPDEFSDHHHSHGKNSGLRKILFPDHFHVVLLMYIYHEYQSPHGNFIAVGNTFQADHLGTEISEE